MWSILNTTVAPTAVTLQASANVICHFNQINLGVRMKLASNPVIDQEQVREKALFELVGQTMTAVMLYPVLWLSLTYSYDVHHTAPVLVNAIAAILIVIAAARALLIRKFSDIYSARPKLAERLLLCGIHLSGFLWGCIGAAIFLIPDFEPIITLFSIAIFGITAMAVTYFALSVYVGMAFNLLLLSPIVLLSLVKDDPMLNGLGILMLVFLLGVYRLGKGLFENNQNLYKLAVIAEERAKLLEKLSVTDFLTQVYNRHHFDGQLKIEWKRAHRNSTSIGAMIVDLDNFKSVNDKHGHFAGDQCIIACANILKAHGKRPYDFAARLGGEEFILILPGADEQQTIRIANSVLEAIAARDITINKENEVIHVTASIGAGSIIPAQHDASTDFLIRVDKALYRAKEQGRNQICASE